MVGIRFGENEAAGAAVWAPLLCGIHCIVTPGLALVAPAFVLSQPVEIGVMVLSGALAAWAFSWAHRAHGRYVPALPMLAGGVLWVVALTEATRLPEWLVAGAGGLLIFAGLRWSMRLRERALAGGCSCSSCDAPTGAR
jgi:hypothetical protein